jgi:hypothetical protein
MAGSQYFILALFLVEVWRFRQGTQTVCNFWKQQISLHIVTLR